MVYHFSAVRKTEVTRECRERDQFNIFQDERIIEGANKSRNETRILLIRSQTRSVAAYCTNATADALVALDQVRKDFSSYFVCTT